MTLTEVTAAVPISPRREAEPKMRVLIETPLGQEVVSSNAPNPEVQFTASDSNM